MQSSDLLWREGMVCRPKRLCLPGMMTDRLPRLVRRCRIGKKRGFQLGKALELCLGLCHAIYSSMRTKGNHVKQEARNICKNRLIIDVSAPSNISGLWSVLASDARLAYTASPSCRRRAVLISKSRGMLKGPLRACGGIPTTYGNSRKIHHQTEAKAW